MGLAQRTQHPEPHRRDPEACSAQQRAMVVVVGRRMGGPGHGAQLWPRIRAQHIVIPPSTTIVWPVR